MRRDKTTPIRKMSSYGMGAFYRIAERSGEAISRIKCPDTHGPMWGGF